MRFGLRFLGFILCTPLLLASCSGGDSTAFNPDGGIPDSAVDPFADSGVFLNVLPPGSADANDGNIEADPNSTNQLVMYENLVFSDDYPTPGQLSNGDLVPGCFKDGPMLDTTAFDTVQTVTDGMHTAHIGRDEMGVPHVFGDERSDVPFGTGYATATDRMFAIDVFGHVGRGRLSDSLGPAGGNYSSGRGLVLAYGPHAESRIARY